jgi:hypothetical protein
MPTNSHAATSVGDIPAAAWPAAAGGRTMSLSCDFFSSAAS